MSWIEVLGMFEGKHRKLTLPEGSKLKSLIKEFMKKFEDVISHNIVPADLFVQKYNPRYQEWVDLGVEEKLFDGEKLRVQIQSSAGSIFPGVVPHKVQGDTTYRIWSLASRSSASLMKRIKTNTMKCNGSVATDQGSVLDITAKGVSANQFRLELISSTPSKIYLITGKGENQEVTAEETDISSLPDTPETKFEPKYFFAFTQFQCSGVNGRKDLYLASDENGKTTLAKGGQPEFPNPATLFICHVFA